MPIAKVIRYSPLYLYLKFYSLSVLVSLFASRPITGRLSGQTLNQIDRIRSAAEEALKRNKVDKAKEAFRDGKKQFNEITKVQTKHLLDKLSINKSHNDFFSSASHISQKALHTGESKGDRKSTRLNSSHSGESRMPSSA